MDHLIAALIFGLSAGITPGPLLTLVIATTLQRGLTAGVRVAASPLLADVPVLLVTFLILRQVPASFLTAITLVGVLFVTWLGARTTRDALAADGPDDDDPTTTAEVVPRDLLRGALVNVLSPHPWLGWLTFG
ncbi:MAG: LysE family transporter, partial [Acidobacteriota bacterium]